MEADTLAIAGSASPFPLPAAQGLKLSAGSGIEVVVSNPVLPIRTVRFESHRPTRRKSERVTICE